MVLLSVIERGIHDADADVELISWHYLGSLHRADWVYEIPSHTSK